MIISNGRNLSLFVELTDLPAWKIIDKFDFRDEVIIDGKPTGLTFEDLSSREDYQKTKRQLIKADEVLRALEKACGRSYPIGKSSKLREVILSQLKRILSSIDGLEKPFEKCHSLYEEHCNKWLKCHKDNPQVWRLIKLGALEWLPEGTFFGNRPKEYTHILVRIPLNNNGYYDLSWCKILR